VAQQIDTHHAELPRRLSLNNCDKQALKLFSMREEARLLSQ
jgi:hypothetical protein